MKNCVILFFVLIVSMTACISVAKTNVPPSETMLPIITEMVITLTLPTPNEGLGVVCGYIINEETGKPPQAALFLSPNIAAGRVDVPAIMSFSFQTNPRAEMNKEGYFCFENVEPGIYALTLWSPPDNVEFVEDDEGQDYLWIEVEPGLILDLGQLSRK